MNKAMEPFGSANGGTIENLKYSIYTKTLFSLRELILDFLPNYNKNTIGCCSHNFREQKRIKKLSVQRVDLSFLLKNVRYFMCHS